MRYIYGTVPGRSGQSFRRTLNTLHTLLMVRPAILCNMPMVDALDARLLTLLAAEPRIGMLAASRRLGVARGTVTARMDRLERLGVVRSFGPDLDPAALGYAVTAFATLELRQRHGHHTVAEQLREIPEVLEAHTITGAGDVLARLVARDNADLQRVLDRVLAAESVERLSTVIVLATEIPSRTLPLLHAAAGT